MSTTDLPSDVRLARQLGALRMHAIHGRDTMQAARAAAFQRFEDEVDPDRVLDPAERQERAEFARRAHMTKLSMLAAKARREKREAAS